MSAAVEKDKPRPRVIADGPLPEALIEFDEGVLEWLPWDFFDNPDGDPVEGIYTYGHPHLDGAMLDRITGCRIISNYGVGVDHIQILDAVERNIPVCNTPGVLEEATADMAMTLLLASARLLVQGDRYARSPEFTVYDPSYMLGREVHHATLGILGLGNIGQHIARRARAFNMRILYHNRSRRPEAERELPAEYVSFDDLLARSDYLVLVCPLTEETRGILDAEALARMKKSATLVNIARGGVVVTGDLYEALRDGVIAAAALDVTDPEPLPRDHPILQLENLTIAPHLGSATVETRRAMAKLSMENLLRGLRGEPLLHRVGL